MPDGTLKKNLEKTLKKPWKTLGGTLKNTKKDLENLEKTLKNAPKIAGNPAQDASLQLLYFYFLFLDFISACSPSLEPQLGALAWSPSLEP